MPVSHKKINNITVLYLALILLSVNGHFVVGHFAEGLFAVGTFHRWDILPSGLFAVGSFRADNWIYI